MWGGLKAPPRTPVRATALLPDLPAAVDDVLGRGQLAQPDRPPRVQLLGRVTDLRAHPELVAVGEPRRRVDVDGRGVNGVGKLVADLGGPGDDRVGVPRPMTVDVLDRI